MFTAAGKSAAASAANYIEDVFSTYLYPGNSSTQTITNGIDLSGKGGMVWIKRRSSIENHAIFDTQRGATQRISSNNTNAQSARSTSLTAFNSNGFALGADNEVNFSSETYASWTFRKQAKFFDVVTYTGNGSSITVPHSLGSTPGCIIVKKTNSATTSDWVVYHRSVPSNCGFLYLTNSFASAQRFSSVTSTNFTINVSTADVNGNGDTYVAYLFAHDAGGFGASGTDNVISCGSYTGNGSTTGPVITLGYEPQFLMIKCASASGNWMLFDNMRGLTMGADAFVNPNLADAESSSTYVQLTPTGFQLETALGTVNASSQTYIYIAIRRGPMRTPTSGTSVFYPTSQTVSAGATRDPGFPVDMTFCSYVTAYNTNYMGLIQDRLRGYATANTAGTYPMLSTTTTSGDTVFSSTNPAIYGINNAQTTIYFGTQAATGKTQVYGFRRAPGFFDVVCYTGTGANRTVAHNLAAVPELIIVKTRNTTSNWPVYSSPLGATGILYLNLTSANGGPDATMWNSTSPTSTVFSLGTNAQLNTSSNTYVAYLFATVAGVSKVGSYTGTGTTKQIDCGFAAGARFVLIKRTDSTGDWYVWDSARGIVAGNDPYLLLNSTAAEVTNTDYVDTYSAGFEISSTAPAAINANGGTFIFLAIA